MPDGTLLTTDPSVEFEHRDEPTEPAAPLKTETDRRFEALEKTIKDQAAELKAARDDARFWAGRNSAPSATADPDDEVQHEEDDTSDISEKPEQFLDDVSKDGLNALKKRGFVTQADVDRQIREAEQRTEARVTARLNDSGFDAKLAVEFPELVEDSKLVKAGKAPTSELYKRTGEIYRASIEEDPQLKGSKSALLIAARQAKAEIKAEKSAKGRESDPIDAHQPRPGATARRERIERLASVPSKNEDRDDEEPGISSEAREVMSKLGVTEAQFVKNRDRGVSNGKR